MPFVRYEWDNAKAALNHRKHGIDFLDAIAALEDPNRLASRLLKNSLDGKGRS
jgi:uncharacterized DUF497 family protein